MNRQVGPSIVLSVLIVCFFAVALYQRDPPRPPRGSARSTAAGAIARSASTPPRGPSRPFSGQSESAELVKPVSGRSEVPARPIASTSDRSIGTSHRVLARSLRAPDMGFVGPDGSRTGEPIEAARQPGSAFTIVDADETLEDVARRIYGSGAVADSLWRANRDALSRRDSQLSAGMVLRTPVLATQSPLRK
jgi:nucleoid-associated protein YgaU